MATFTYTDSNRTASAGTTGTGLSVAQTSPALVTPSLGVAGATSINFGGTALANYLQGTWTPTFTCATPGDLSVVYATQSGTYTRIGNIVYVAWALEVTPTFTTASGGIQVGGLPLVPASNNAGGIVRNMSSGFTWPAGITSVLFGVSSGNLALQGVGSATGLTGFQMTTIVSGAGGLLLYGSATYTT